MVRIFEPSTLVFALSLALSSCGDDAGWSDEPLELSGVYATSFGQEIRIDAAQWGPYLVREVDNAANRMVFEVDLGGGTIFGRLTWTEPDFRGSFFFCFEVTSTSDIEVARSAASTADPREPAVTGCGGQPWAQAWRAVDVRGEYEVDGLPHTITATVWRRPEGEMVLAAWDNAQARVVATSPGNALPYVVIDWAPAPESGGWWFCDTEGSDESAVTAFSTVARAEPSNPAESGCRGGPWQTLRPR